MQHFVLEQALNYLIDQGDADLSALNGKTLYFALEDLPLDVNFVCTNDRIFVTTDTSAGADVDIKLKSSVFLALFQGEDLTELLRQDKIIIHGDVKTAQLLVDLLQQIDTGLEEVLSKYTGDIVAYQVGKLAKNFKASDNPLESIKNELTTLFVAPSESDLFRNKGS
ncbi:MAG: SCP2 sterol-binding domain-containing protein [Gammaproteobacteria bacterium]|nr:SCP2 sterol-binding domain-containing protein [Gammaproteobacteria bacterium]